MGKVDRLCNRFEPFAALFCNGVVESLFIITVYLRIKDCSGMNIQFNNIADSYIYWVFRYNEIINI